MSALLERVIAGGDLLASETEDVFARIVRGEADGIALGALLVALRMKGETADEIAGAARALLSAAEPFAVPDYPAMDCCGTGGDGRGTLNVSTATAFVLAALGVKIAKHGNRAVSSQSGSTDVLHALGIATEVSADRSRALLDQHNLCFLHAPLYHPGVRHAMPVRQALKVRTLFNLLGPIINPARPSLRLMGVYDERFLDTVAETLRSLGIARAYVVNGEVDEFAIHTTTQVAELKNGVIRRMIVTPESAGLPRHDIEQLKGGVASDNAREIVALLNGEGRPAFRDAVTLNAAAGLLLAGKVADLRQGAEAARECLAAARPARVLRALQQEIPHVA